MNNEGLAMVIGQLEGRLDALTVQNNEARESRKIIHDKLNGINSSITDVEAKISHMDNRLSELEPVVGLFSRWRERATGVVLFLSLVLATIGAVIAALWEKALAFIGLK